VRKGWLLLLHRHHSQRMRDSGRYVQPRDPSRKACVKVLGCGVLIHKERGSRSWRGCEGDIGDLHLWQFSCLDNVATVRTDKDLRDVQAAVRFFLFSTDFLLMHIVPVVAGGMCAAVSLSLHYLQTRGRKCGPAKQPAPVFPYFVEAAAFATEDDLFKHRDLISKVLLVASLCNRYSNKFDDDQVSINIRVC
jgi:hypothetical protein